ncbi:unnamed protein product [Ixodes pacificus]
MRLCCRANPILTAMSVNHIMALAELGTAFWKFLHRFRWMTAHVLHKNNSHISPKKNALSKADT